METILPYTLDYLKLKLGEQFKLEKKKVGALFTCPFCKNTTCNFVGKTYRMYCLDEKCSKLRKHKFFSLYEVVKALEVDKAIYSDEDIWEYIKETFKLDIVPKTKIKEALDFYEKNGFDLVPVARDRKNPIETEWTIKVHKDRKEWEEWIRVRANIGLKVGKCSNVLCLDFDTKEIPEEVKKLIPKTFYQISTKGLHYFFLYDPDFPKTRIEEYKLDIETDGGQVVMFPSMVEGVLRKPHIYPLLPIPKELKELLLSKITIKPLKTFSEKYIEDIDLSNIDIASLGITPIPEGSRNSFLLRLGGILRKELNQQQTELSLSIVNKNLCKPPLPLRELSNIVTSIEKYRKFDEQELAIKILSYMRIVEEAKKRDIIERLGEFSAEGKIRIDKAIAYLLKEELIINKRGTYFLIKKMEWKETYIEDENLINYKIPYFDDYAIIRNGDLIIIGGKTGSGKCIANGYILTSSKGFIDIAEYGKDFPEGITYLENEHLYYGKKTYSFKAAYFYKEKVNKTIKIKTNYGFELEGTSEHPILCIVNNKLVFRKLSELSIGDKVVISNGKNLPNIVTMSKYYDSQICKNVRNIIPIYLPVVMDKDLARLLGYFVADGNWNNGRIQISNSKDYIIKDITNIAKKMNLDSTTFTNGSTTTTTIDSSLLSGIFENIFSGRPTAKYKSIPKCVLEADEEIKKAFLEAYLSCDTDCINSSLSICSASELLINQLQSIILCFGVVGRKFSRKVKEYPDNIYYGLNFNRKQTYKLSTILSIEKYKDKIFPPIENQKWHRNYLEQPEEHLYINDIVDIKEINEEKYVYDFNIPDYHAFWSNGFISHNTHISANLMKQVIEQGIKPCYISLEGSSRFKKIGMSLGIAEGSFRRCTHFSPETIVIEKNAFTIIDWLLPDDYAETDKLYKRLAEQLSKQGGVLIVFTQLRHDGNFFAPDMIEMFASLAVKFLYEDEQGTNSYFEFTKIREPKKRIKKGRIPLTYNWDTKELSIIKDEEIKDENNTK